MRSLTNAIGNARRSGANSCINPPIGARGSHLSGHPAAMTYHNMKINDNCVACGACVSACPSEAIHEGSVYRIDPEACVDCGACMSACPNSAIEN